MKLEVKKLWIEALRSGKYEQGRGALNKDGKFCCLGVLCDLAVKAGVEVEVNKDAVKKVFYNGNAWGLPLSI